MNSYQNVVDSVYKMPATKDMEVSVTKLLAKNIPEKEFINEIDRLAKSRIAEFFNGDFKTWTDEKRLQFFRDGAGAKTAH